MWQIFKGDIYYDDIDIRYAGKSQSREDAEAQAESMYWDVARDKDAYVVVVNFETSEATVWGAGNPFWSSNVEWTEDERPEPEWHGPPRLSSDGLGRKAVMRLLREKSDEIVAEVMARNPMYDALIRWDV